MWFPKNYCLLLVSLLVMGMALSAIAEEQKKEEIANSEPSTASTANPENPVDQEKPKDLVNFNPEKPEEKSENLGDKDPESPADLPQQDDPKPEEPNQDGPKEDAPQHEGVQAPTTTENPSELTIESVINKLINADKADLKFCKFHLASYEIKYDNKSDNVKSESITQEMVDERLKDMVGKHQASEQAVNDAASVGIKNEGFFNEFDIKDAASPEAKGFEANMDLLNGGAAEMVKIFTRWAEQGPELRQMIHLGVNSAKFNVEAGLTNSQVRLARNIYCVKKLALNVKNEFKHAEKPKPMRRTQNAEAAKGLIVSYAITTVWIGQESVSKMKQIVKVSNELETMVHSAQNGMVKRAGLAVQREAMAKAIEELANAEDQMMYSDKLDDIGRGTKKGSSMALMGVIFEKSCKDNLNVGCIQFFHVHSDDEYSP